MVRNIFGYIFFFLVIAFFSMATIRPSVQIIAILLTLFLIVYILFRKKIVATKYASYTPQAGHTGLLETSETLKSESNSPSFFRMLQSRWNSFVDLGITSGELRLSKNEKLLSLAFLAMGLSAVPPLLVNNSLVLSLRELNIAVEYVLFALIMWLGLRSDLKIKPQFLFFLIIFAGFLNGVISIVHLYLFPEMLMKQRLQGYIGINQYGLFCAVLCILNGVLFLFGNYKRSLCFIASLLSIVGVVGSGLRGVLLSLLCIYALIIIFIFVKKITKRSSPFSLSFLVLFLSTILIGYATSKTMPIDRMKSFVIETQAISNGDYETSIGFRIQIYKEAWAMFLLSPVIGMSAKTALDKAQEIVEVSKTTHIFAFVNANKPLYGKTHNEVLNFMAKRGLIGLFSLLFFYFMIARICLMYRTSIFGMLGLGMLAVYIGVGLSADPLTGHGEASFFVLLLLFILMAAKGEESEKFSSQPL